MEEIKIGMIGSVDASKTSTTSTLINKILDDGKGSARKLILKLKHEQETGRTSSITENYLRNGNKYISFIDLAGHERYLKTTMYGLSGHHIDYVLIFVGANMGISRITEEHLILAITLKIPFIFIVSKIDLAPENIMKETIENIVRLVKRMRIPQSEPYIIYDHTQLDEINLATTFPIFCISNKTGQNLDLLRDYLLSLNTRYHWQLNTNELKFIINNKYNVKGIGTVFSGKLVSGTLKKGDKLLLGPFNGKWINIMARSLHDNFRNNVEQLIAGESGCIAVATKTDLLKHKLRKGIIVVNKLNQNAIKRFDAEISILTRHSTTIKKGYSPIVNCGTVAQMVKIINIYEKDILRCGDRALVQLEFSFRPEYILEGDRFVFRDGRTKGFGKVMKTY